MRKHKPQLVLDHNYLLGLNDYFGDLCHDHDYAEPDLLVIDTEVKPPPQLSEFDVLRELSRIKRTATRSDSIPYCVWKNYADHLTPVVTPVWNLSLSTHTWPLSGKRRT